MTRLGLPSAFKPLASAVEVAVATLIFGVPPTFALRLRVRLALRKLPSLASCTTTSPPSTCRPPIVRSIRTWLEPSRSTMTSLTTNASALVARNAVKLFAIAALALATAVAGVGTGSAVGAPVAVVALVRPRAAVVATAVAAANRADLFILALLVRCPGGLTPQERGAGTLPLGHLPWPELGKSALSTPTPPAVQSGRLRGQPRRLSVAEADSWGSTVRVRG